MTLQLHIRPRSFAKADFRLGWRLIWGALTTYLFAADLRPELDDLPFVGVLGLEIEWSVA